MLCTVLWLKHMQYEQTMPSMQNTYSHTIQSAFKRLSTIRANREGKQHPGRYVVHHCAVASTSMIMGSLSVWYLHNSAHIANFSSECSGLLPHSKDIKLNTISKITCSMCVWACMCPAVGWHPLPRAIVAHNKLQPSPSHPRQELGK